MSRRSNPVRAVIHWIGLALVHAGLIERERARRTADLAWPRIVTGLARMSKNAADVAMVGLAVGTAAIAGVGFASSFWGLAFALGGGLAGGTIALVSQRFGADAYDEVGGAIRSSVLVVLAITVPLGALFWTVPTELIDLVSNDPKAIALGTEYLRIVALGVPFAGLNLVGSRALVGCDDAWVPMVIRAGGAVLNVAVNALLLFGLDLGVRGAAIGTVLATLAVTATFAFGLVTGSVPGIGAFPVTVDPLGAYADRETVGQLVKISTPLIGTNLSWRVGEFPLLAIVDTFGTPVVAAFVITQRVRGLMNTPGWGFSLASSSLVGQELGSGDEERAEAYGRDVIRFALAVYLVSAASVFVLARPVALVFVGSETNPALPFAVLLIRAACVAVVFQGISRAATGPLRSSGDTRWPFYGQMAGMYLFAIPVAYLGTVTPLGLWGIVGAIVVQMLVPAVVNYHRFSTGKWKQISRAYRSQGSVGDD